MQNLNPDALLSGSVSINNAFPVQIYLLANHQIVAYAGISIEEAFEQTWAHYTLPLCELDIEPSIQSLSVVLQNGETSTLKEIPISHWREWVNSDKKRIQVIEKIAPSLGFVGGALYDPLTARIDKQVTSVTLRVIENAAFLNFAGLSLIDKDGKKVESSLIKDIHYSSCRNTENVAQSVLDSMGFHSEQEDQPFLTFTFNEPLELSSIAFHNRNDRWGVRAKRLQISVTDINGHSHILAEQGSDRYKVGLYQKLQRLLGYRGFNANTTHKQLLLNLRDHFGSIDLNDKANHSSYALILPFLSTWGTGKVKHHSLELDLLALYLASCLHTRLSLNLRCFERLLPSKASIQLLEDKINQRQQQNNLPLIAIMKHGTAPISKLTREPQKFLNSIAELITDLEEMGLRPCLAYGTLLGAVREQAFISHDDDVDLLIECDHSVKTVADALQFQISLADRFDRNKYIVKRATLQDDNLNLHVYCIESGVLIDLFPYWNNDGQSFMHMEKMAIRSIPEHIMQERDTASLYNMTFPAPGESQLFLQQRYGNQWHISNKYHEWPWQLEEDNV